MFNDRRVVAAASVIALSLTLAACTTPTTDAGGGPPSSSPTVPIASFNNQDVTFAQAMVQHHTQAIEMSQVILDKNGIDPQVTDLATQIKSAQQPEIDEMNSWLRTWGESGKASTMDHDMNGMMSEADMTALKEAAGADAGKLFLQQMIQHHQGAIDMAQTEVKDGKNPESVGLAQKIIQDQSDEIAIMQELLSKL